ncbi:MAG: hypothetical protein GX666_02000 [Tissierellia bacterium]|nr:hypothetical protein [Tissierellia bacterium]
MEYSAKDITLRINNPDGEITIINKKLADDTKIVTAKKEWSGDKDWN